MNRKTTLDMAILLSRITGIILSYFYLENTTEKQISILILGVLAFFFFILFLLDSRKKNTDYAGTVDSEHAVMNYSNGSWYIEDLDSENGTRAGKICPMM